MQKSVSGLSFFCSLNRGAETSSFSMIKIASVLCWYCELQNRGLILNPGSLCGVIGMSWVHHEPVLALRKCWLKLHKQHDASYGWIADQQHAHKKSIFQQIRRATTIPRPPLKSSRQGKLRSAVTSFVKPIFGVLFLKHVKTGSQQKWSRQIWIRLVEHFRSKVSNPFEVPRINCKMTF